MIPRRTAVLIAIVATVFLAAGLVAWWLVRPSPAAACVASPDELCPSDLFSADFAHLKTLTADINLRQRQAAQAQLQREVDEANGLTQRLAAQVPQGYRWDDGKRRFIRVPATPTPPPATPSPSPSPTPAPAAGGKK